jgi:hypothetical protein
MESDTTASPLAWVASSVTVGIGIVTVVVSLLLYFHWNYRDDVIPHRTKSTANVGTKTSGKQQQQQQQSQSSHPIQNPVELSTSSQQQSINDVWEERRRRGIPAASLHVKKDITHKNSKPFGSSYYYAHNSTKTVGGYKDGLTMEDYTMNGPRLLSRNGQPIDNTNASNITDDSQPQLENVVLTPSISASIGIATADASVNQPQPSRRVLAITRYLWDDPGSSTGIATIRIDVLPSHQHNHTTNNVTATIPWKDIRSSITNISTSIINVDTDKGTENGLLVKLEALIATTIDCCKNDDDGTIGDGSAPPSAAATAMTLSLPRYVDYTLRIPKLYGPIHKVETSNREKRFVIRLHKTNTWLDKSNLKVWPHPHKV